MKRRHIVEIVFIALIIIVILLALAGGLQMVLG